MYIHFSTYNNFNLLTKSSTNKCASLVKQEQRIMKFENVMLLNLETYQSKGIEEVHFPTHYKVDLLTFPHK